MPIAKKILDGGCSDNSTSAYKASLLSTRGAAYNCAVSFKQVFTHFNPKEINMQELSVQEVQAIAGGYSADYINWAISNMALSCRLGMGIHSLAGAM